MEKPGRKPPIPPQAPVAHWEPLSPSKRAASAPVATWRRAGDEPAQPVAPHLPKASWERAEPIVPRTQAMRAQARWERVGDKVASPEQLKKVEELERGIAEAKRGLKEVEEAFDYKANAPGSPHRDIATVAEWADKYGNRGDTWEEAFGRAFDTQDSRLRADARQYAKIRLELRTLEVDLLRYKQEHGLN